MIAAGGMLWLMYLNSLPHKNGLTDQIFLSMSIIVLAFFALMLMPILMLAKGWHRSFRVRVDVLARSCRCSRRVFGIRVCKREIDTRYAEWDVESEYVPYQAGGPRADSSSMVLAVVLLLLGPLGWVIAAMTNSDRNDRREKVWTGQAMVRLRVSDRDETIALITVPDEAVAREFLLAWDRHFARNTRV
ncbi:MAG: hypothetical protein AAGA25_04955 [Planctomycetota bacterium]